MHPSPAACASPSRQAPGSARWRQLSSPQGQTRPRPAQRVSLPALQTITCYTPRRGLGRSVGYYASRSTSRPPYVHYRCCLLASGGAHSVPMQHGRDCSEAHRRRHLLEGGGARTARPRSLRGRRAARRRGRGPVGGGIRSLFSKF
jgi:hypothetical protein